jgi:hypothetical protein
MIQPHCSKPTDTIIKVGHFEAGIVGLDDISERARASGQDDEQKLEEVLVPLARQRGHYIAPAVEELCK